MFNKTMHALGVLTLTLSPLIAAEALSVTPAGDTIVHNTLNIGTIGATVNEISTDGTLGDDSDVAIPTEKAVKTYVDAAIASTSGPATHTTLAVGTGVTVNEISADGTLGGDSDEAIPTEKAVKAYVDAMVASSPLGSGPVLIEEKVISGSMPTLNFVTGITNAYKSYEIRFDYVAITTSGAAVRLQFSTDSGASWMALSSYRYGRKAFNHTKAQSIIGSTQPFIQLTSEMLNGSSDLQSPICGEMQVYGLGYNRQPKCKFEFIFENSFDQTSHIIGMGSTYTPGTYNGLKFFLTTGSFDGGTVSLWGIP